MKSVEESPSVVAENANLPRKREQGTIAVLDGLRGVAIIMVVLCHAIYIPEGRNGFFDRLIYNLAAAGGYGVPIFFCLSGFLISLPFWKEKRLGRHGLPHRYFQKRFWRIYPALFASALILVPIYIHWKGDWEYLKWGGRYLLGIPFIESFFGPVGNEFNPVLWSLLVEVQFYATIPLLFWLARRVSHEKLLYGLPAALFIFTMGWGIFRGLEGGNFYPTTEPDISTGYPVSLLFFPLGMLVGGLYESGKLERFACRRWANTGVFVLIAGIAWLTYRRFGDPASFWEGLGILLCFLIGSALMLFSVASDDTLLKRILSHPWLCWIGVVSYEWYLLHQIIILYVRDIAGPAGGSLFKYVCVLSFGMSLSLVLAGAMFHFISKPCLLWGRRD